MKPLITLPFVFPTAASKEETKKPIRDMQKIKTLNEKLSENYKDISVLADVKDEWGRVIRAESGNYFHLQLYHAIKSQRLDGIVSCGKNINAKYMGTMVLPGLKADIAALDKLLNETLDPYL